MHGVGFEPTRTNTLELKTNPLDQLGQPCLGYYLEITSFRLSKCLSI